MACLKTLKGIGTSCDTVLSGIKSAYIANREDVSAVTKSSTAANVVSGITMSGDAKFMHYHFKKQTGSLTSTLSKDETNGYRFYTNEIALQFTKLEAAKHLEIEALAAGELITIIETNDNKLWLVGYDSYVSATEATAQTGTAFTDMSGYQITMSAMESTLPLEVPADVLTGIVAEPA